MCAHMKPLGFVVIDVFVVAAVIGRPVEAGIFKGTGTKNQSE